MSTTETYTDGELVETFVDNGDGTGERIVDGKVVEQFHDLPLRPPEPEPLPTLAEVVARVDRLDDAVPPKVENPDVTVEANAMQAEVASLRATVDALTAALDKVIDIAAVQADADAGKADAELLLKVADALGTSVEECARLRAEAPEKWAAILADLGLDGGKGDGGGGDVIGVTP